MDAPKKKIEDKFIFHFCIAELNNETEIYKAYDRFICLRLLNILKYPRNVKVIKLSIKMMVFKRPTSCIFFFFIANFVVVKPGRNEERVIKAHHRK